MRIVIDAMGGDHAPEQIVQGAIDALEANKEIKILLVGTKEKISSILDKRTYDKKRLELIPTTEVIENEDSPVRSLRRKPNSSLVVAMNLIRNKEGDVLVSAGNTGAVVAGAQLILGKIDGVDRPALTTIIPTKDDFSLLLDAGANPSCRPVNFLQFGIMGYHYMKQVCDIENPKVCLLNVGAEEKKGNETVKAAHLLLKEGPINFKGNVEGRDIINGAADVVVCDGFTGNVAIKVMEGTALFMSSMIKDIINTSLVTKISGLLLKNDLMEMKKKLDYSEYGGAPLLGVKGKVIKCHGSSNAKAIKNAILRFAVDFAKSTIIEDITEEFRSLEIESIDEA